MSCSVLFCWYYIVHKYYYIINSILLFTDDMERLIMQYHRYGKFNWTVHSQRIFVSHIQTRSIFNQLICALFWKPAGLYRWSLSHQLNNRSIETSDKYIFKRQYAFLFVEKVSYWTLSNFTNNVFELSQWLTHDACILDVELHSIVSYQPQLRLLKCLYNISIFYI